eukprot:COSAG01_NODE_3932_length_5522_cov_153.687258_4_plen_150_part_00
MPPPPPGRHELASPPCRRASACVRACFAIRQRHWCVSKQHAPATCAGLCVWQPRSHSQGHWLAGCTHGYSLEQGSLPLPHQRHGEALPPRARRAPHAVDVGLVLGGQVEVDHVLRSHHMPHTPHTPPRSSQRLGCSRTGASPEAESSVS